MTGHSLLLLPLQSHWLRCHFAPDGVALYGTLVTQRRPTDPPLGGNRARLGVVFVAMAAITTEICVVVELGVVD